MYFFTYAYQKILASVIRVVAGRQYNPYNPTPDEVIHIPSRDPHRTIKAHLYKSKSQQPTPLLINFHGSGFILPLHGSDDEFAHRVVDNTTYAVLDVSYRLAPEYPHPAAPNDVEDAIKWALARPQEFNISRIAVSGFSAGGTLALIACSALFPKGTFDRVIGVYPPVDFATAPEQKVAPDQSGKPLADWMTTAFNDCYMPPPIDRKGPTVSPFYTPAEQFPDRLVIITCACDNLCVETETLAYKIGKVPGKRLVHRRMEGCDHAWDKMYTPDSLWEKRKEEAYELILAELNADTQIAK